MRIYVTHSKYFDFRKELYSPLRNSSLNSLHEIVLSHEKSDELFSSKDFIPTCDVIIAEVSLRSTGQGIELGWANAANVPIICIYKQGTKPAGSLKAVSNIFLEYEDREKMIQKIEEVLTKIKT